MHTAFNTIGLFLFAILLSLFPTGVALTQQHNSGGSVFEITIDTLNAVHLGTDISIPVYKTAGTGEIHGFDFLIGYDPTALQLTSIEEGELFDPAGSYQWEYFETTMDSLIDCPHDSCPPAVIHAVAVANINNGPHVPLEFNLPDGTELFRLNFTVTENHNYECTWVPLRFFWTDCGDNGLAVPLNETVALGISSNVYDFTGEYQNIADPGFGLPGYYGAPDSCVKDSTATIRMVDYYNGGVEIRCDDTVAAEFEITIDTLRTVQLGADISIPVYKTAGTGEFHGFDFLIGYDLTALQLTGIEEGDIFDPAGSYQWEYFETTMDSLIDCPNDSCPSAAIHVVAVADLNNGSHLPLEFNLPDGTELFRLNFTVTDNRNYECTWIPLRFFWSDCGDNGLAVPVNETVALGISSGVYDFTGEYQNIADPGFGLPGYYGAPDSCVKDSVATIRLVDYYNGGLDIKCYDTIDWRGDINLNGIPYEIADWVLFTGYFFDGLEVFNVDVAASIEASDANADWTSLQIEDLVYLYRVICGDAIPIPQSDTVLTLPTDSVVFTHDVPAQTVSVEYHDTLAAVFLLFDGEITPTFLVDTVGLQVGYSYDGKYSAVLIQPRAGGTGECRTGFLSGPLFSYTGQGTILMDETDDNFRRTGAADFNNHVFVNNRLEVIGGGYDVDRGDVNINGIAYEIADWVLFTGYFFDGLEVFNVDIAASIEASDANADGTSLQTEDLVYLYRVICGDAVPIPQSDTVLTLPTDSVVFTHDVPAQTVSVEYHDTLAAVFLLFAGEITPTFLVDTTSHLCGYSCDGEYSAVIIQPRLGGTGECRTGFLSGPLFSYTGQGILLLDETDDDLRKTGAADFNNHVFVNNRLEVIGGGDDIICGDVNGDETVNIGDAVFLVAHLFRAGPAPGVFRAGDLNLNGTLEVGDATVLINYIFRNGPKPSCARR